MRIIIFEEDYSDINVIHQTIQKIASAKEFTIHQVLTTRKRSSIQNYLQQYKADLYVLSIDSTFDDFEFVQMIQTIDPKGQILLVVNSYTTEREVANFATNNVRILKKTADNAWTNSLTEAVIETYVTFKRSLNSIEF